MSSQGVLPSSPRRQLLSPKSVRRAFGAATTGNYQSCSPSFCPSSTTTTTTTTKTASIKRPANDENFDPARGLASHKRTKSVLGNSTNTILWDDKIRVWTDENAPPAKGMANSRAPLMDKKGVANTLVSSTAIKSSAKALNDSSTIAKRRYNESLEMTKPRISSPLKKPLSLRNSPPRLSPPRSRKRNVSRIDPPLPLRPGPRSSIDEVLRFAPSYARDCNYSLSSDEAEGGVPLIVTGLGRDHAMPDSWSFTIYEDSPAETLQNLMEHSAGTLDISDDSDDDLRMDEILQKGKENIPPARLQELLTANKDREHGIERVRAKPTHSHRRTAMGGLGKIIKGKREVLGGLRVEDFYPRAEKLAAAKQFVPVAEKAEVDIYTGYPRALKLDDLYEKSENKIEIWESESAKEESEDEGEDGGVRLRSRACSPTKEDPRTL